MSIKVVDLFAGAGGFSEGARQAGGSVLWCGNHWPSAVEWHSANHPETLHICQDLHQVDWSQVPTHDLLLASPACQGHSRARGKDQPRHDASRSTAWAVVSCAEYHRPPLVLVENVPEFLQWTLYPAWELAMQALGYAITPYVLDAADHGVPQNRIRLFLACSQSKAPLMLSLPKREHKPVSEIIRFDQGNWSPVAKKGRSPVRLAQWQRGRAQHGDQFVMPYYGSGSGLTGRSLARPLGTVTTRDRWAVVDGDRMRMLTADECRAAMGFPDGYKLPTQHKLAVHLLGNAVVPVVARDLILAIQEAA